MFSSLKKTSTVLFIAMNSSLFSSTFAQSSDSSDDDGLKNACWIDAYGRGVGKVISVCPSGLEDDAALCYPPCKDGYNGVGPVCWQNCPDGFTNTGIDCLKPSAYGRGTGYFLWHEQECEDQNPQGCEKYGALYYPKCKEGYYAFGCCICSPDCPDGMTDIGISCQKQTYGRGVGKPLVCASGLEEDAGLCYPPCKKGYDGVGPVCWGICPSGLYQCGALCVEDETHCIGDIITIATEVLDQLSDDCGDDDSGTTYSGNGLGIPMTQQLESLPTCSSKF